MTNATQSKHLTPAQKDEAAQRMFGLDRENLEKFYGPDSFNWKGCGSPAMLVASMLSDAQHLMEPGHPDDAAKGLDEARQLLNRAKWVLSKSLRLEREADTVKAEVEAKAVGAENATKAAIAQGLGDVVKAEFVEALGSVRVEFDGGRYAYLSSEALYRLALATK
jgi:hypothetical protein